MAQALTIRLAAVAGFSAVALGAFGAHALRAQLAAAQWQSYQTAVQYHFYHALALLAVALLLQRYPERVWWRFSAALFAAGIVLFSGSLYLLAIVDRSALPAFWVWLTPAGGVSFLMAWFGLFWGAGKS